MEARTVEKESSKCFDVKFLLRSPWRKKKIFVIGHLNRPDIYRTPCLGEGKELV
jgi:hypothetical protein